MKKLLFCMVACLAIIQSVSAAESPGAESLRIYNAIANSSVVFAGIHPNAFVIDIKRKTKDLYATNATYALKTIQHNKVHTYNVLVTVTQNPGVEPNTIVVDSIFPK